MLVKLIFTAITLAAMLLAGRRYFPPGADVHVVSFGAALLFTTWAILSIGFVIASMVPTARFAQPLATMIVYPMLGVSGLFYPIERMPPVLQTIAKVSPLTYAVSLLDGIWKGESWLAHGTDVAALVADVRRSARRYRPRYSGGSNASGSSLVPDRSYAGSIRSTNRHVALGARPASSRPSARNTGGDAMRCCVPACMSLNSR